MKRDRTLKSLHSAISTFLTQRFPLPTFHVLITVTQVSVSPDGRFAKVWLSLMPVGRDDELSAAEVGEMMGLIAQVKPALKKYLSLRLGRHLRRIPDLLFVQDRSALKASEVSKVLATLRD